MLPNTIVIGAQKCATTSLHWYLNEHPEIEVARRKPLSFFVSGEDRRHGNLPMNWHRGVDWYAAACPDRGKVRLESSPDYTNHPHYRGVAEQMKAVIPDAKLIYIVRNPIERLISHYLHNYTGNLEHRSIENACFDLKGSSYVSRGCYGMQLDSILTHFDPGRILIITREGLLRKRRETLSQVFRFLRVDEEFWTDRFNIIRHETTAKRRNNAVGLAIDRTVGRHILAHLHGRQRYLFRRIFYTPFSSPVRRPVLDSSLRERFTDIFGPDLECLARLTGQPFERLLLDPRHADLLCHNPV